MSAAATCPSCGRLLGCAVCGLVEEACRATWGKLGPAFAHEYVEARDVEAGRARARAVVEEHTTPGERTPRRSPKAP